MKILIIFDSVYGNTQKIADSVASIFTKDNQVQITKVSDAKISDLTGNDLLIIGSPVHGGRPSPVMQTFLDSIPQNYLKNTKVAAFDTRILAQTQGFALRILIGVIGYASPKIVELLKSKGAQVLVPPEGFIVKGKEGPLEEGEMDRAKEWGKSIFLSL
jgi:flavodoxin